jgi:hypothetical protein
MISDTMMKVVELGYALRNIRGTWWLMQSYLVPVAGPFASMEEAAEFAEKYRP